MKTFGGIPAEFGEYTTSNVVLLPVAYDGTSTWGKGADKGPSAFLHAAENMELYDIETNSEVYNNGIFLSNCLTGFSTPELMTQAIYDNTNKIIASGKLFTMVGGEHSVSIGAMRAMREHYSDITIVQLDAHADLRPEYNGSVYNHACAMHEISKSANLLQVGIRSMDSIEIPFLKQENVFWAHEICCDVNWVQKVANKCTSNVYVSIDLDVFDPSVLPGTGTPEPGGLNWYQVMNLLKQISSKFNIVGFDITELSPIPGQKVSEFLAAKLYYRFLSMIFKFNKK
jgi:agmatinase